MASTDTAIRRPRRAPTCRSWPSATCGCTSRGWAPTTTSTTSRSSPAARAPTSTTSTATATSTGSPALFCVNAGHGRTELGEAAARQVARARLLHDLELRAPARDRARRRGSRRSPPATSTASSSPPAARRRSSRRSSSRATTTSGPATRASIKFIAREIAYHGTTLGALQATGITALRTDFEPLVPGGSRRRTPTATTGPRTATRSGPPTRSRSGSSSRGRRRSPR